MDECPIGPGCPCRTIGSARLRQVLHRLLTADSEKQAAAGLGITLNTFHKHARHVYAHVGVEGRVELMAQMLRRLSDESRHLSNAAGSTARRKSGGRIRLSIGRSRRMKK